MQCHVASWCNLCNWNTRIVSCYYVTKATWIKSLPLLRKNAENSNTLKEILYPPFDNALPRYHSSERGLEALAHFMDTRCVTRRTLLWWVANNIPWWPSSDKSNSLPVLWPIRACVSSSSRVHSTGSRLRGWRQRRMAISISHGPFFGTFRCLEFVLKAFRSYSKFNEKIFYPA